MESQAQEPRHSWSRLKGFVAAVLTVLLLSGVLWYLLRPPGPAYRGKTAASWFREFQAVYSRSFVIPIRNSSFPAGARGLDVRLLRQSQAATGLRALGTNAAVYLGREFVREDSAADRRYWKLYALVPGRLRKFLRQPMPRAFIRSQVRLALEALGEDAAAAAPIVVTGLRSRDRMKVSDALKLLEKLPFDRGEVEAIIEDWSREGRHTEVVQAVAQLQLRSTTAVRCLARALSAGGPTSRRAGVFELEQCQTAAAVALPELIAALKDTDDEVRYGAARALGAIGSGAAPAVPALMAVTNDSSTLVRYASARSLRLIQGQSAE